LFSLNQRWFSLKERRPTIFDLRVILEKRDLLGGISNNMMNKTTEWQNLKLKKI